MAGKGVLMQQHADFVIQSINKKTGFENLIL
jgi:hypothetical protein